jgi:lipopolysaccharide export system protein LptA
VQGHITISADTLEIRQTGAEQTHIIATGSPATFVQPKLGDDPAIDAKANIIRYEQIARKVILEQDARIQRGESIISGPVIEYFIDEKRVEAGQETQGPKTRVEVVIPSSDGSR